MNAIVPIASIAPGLPAASQALTEVLYDAVRNATSAAEPLPIAAPDHVRREAARRADLLEGVLEGAGPERASRWLLKLARLTARPPEDLEGAVHLMARFLADMPAFVFTGRTLESAASAFKFWPEYRDLKIHFGTIAAPVRAEVAGLRRVQHAPAAAGPEAAEGRPDPAYVKAQLAKLRQDLAAARPASNREPVKAARLSHTQLIVAYREQIAEGRDTFGLAALRLRALENAQADAMAEEMAR